MAFMLRDIRSGESHPIPERGLRIGREAGNDLVLPDDAVSRHHATVWTVGDQVYVRDENSTNGTWVNERRIFTPTLLRPGDRVRLGQTVLEVVRGEAGVTVAIPGVAYPPPAVPYPAAPPVTPSPPSVAAPPRRLRLPLILGLGGAGLLLLCGAAILILMALKVPLPGIAPRPSPTPAPTATPTHTPTPTFTPTPTPTPTPEPTPTPSNAWTIIMEEDFEGDFPGQWELEDSKGYRWGKSSCRSYTGDYSGWAVGGGTRGQSLSCGDRYPDGVTVKMIYGPFSLQGATAAELRFRYWINTEAGSDVLCWVASDDGKGFSGECSSGSDTWEEDALDLSDVYELGSLLGHSKVWVGFYFITDQSVTRSEGAYVDDIVLRKCTYPGGRCK